MHLPIVQGICTSDRFLMISRSVYVNMVLGGRSWFKLAYTDISFFSVLKGFFIVQMLFLLYF